MEIQDSATDDRPVALRTPTDAGRRHSARPDGHSGAGLLLAAAAVTTFSLTFPATVWALDGLGPWSVVTLRATLAALLAGLALLLLRVPVPHRRQWTGLAVAATGTVIGFPLLTTLALQTAPASHAAVVVGLLPLTTAAYSALRTGHRPSATFWTAAGVGATVVLVFALRDSGGAPTAADGLLGLALLVCAAGYAEGGRLAREMPGWQVAAWALVACLPAAACGAVLALSAEPAQLTVRSVAGLCWLAVVAQCLGMLAWYRGMALSGVARASQVQLAQPLLTLVWSVLLLGERLGPEAPTAAAAVLVCIAVTQRARG